MIAFTKAVGVSMTDEADTHPHMLKSSLKRTRHAQNFRSVFILIGILANFDVLEYVF